MAKKKVERKYDNSAIGSWAGYIYQGLCGVYHCLKLLAEDEDKYKDYKLCLDSWEDFAIMDDTGKIVSLHQCKNEKNVTNYTEEYEKMKEKLEILSNDAEVKCDADCKLYFHTNKDVKEDDEIIMYPFTESQKKCESGMLLRLIKKQVEGLLQKDKETIQKVVCALEALVEYKVLDVHQKYIEKDNKKALREIAKEEAMISFQTIWKTLFVEEEVFATDRESYILRIRYKLIDDLDDICNDEDYDEITAEQKSRISFMKEHLLNMSVDETESFFKRVNPIDDLTKAGVDNYADVVPIDKARFLFNVVSELEQLDDDLSWNTDKGKETPTSLSNSMSTAQLCRKIIRNKTNNYSLYEYDWLVGDVRGTVDDIGRYLPKISDVDGKGNDERSIFEMKKVGLVCKQDRINGEY